MHEGQCDRCILAPKRRGFPMPMAERVEALLSSPVSQSTRNRQRVVGQSVGQKRTTCTRRRYERTRGTPSHKPPRSGAEVQECTTASSAQRARTADPQCVAVDGRGREKQGAGLVDQYKKSAEECGICGRMRRRAPVYGKAKSQSAPRLGTAL